MAEEMKAKSKPLPGGIPKTADEKNFTHPETGEPCTFHEFCQWQAGKYVKGLNNPEIDAE